MLKIQDLSKSYGERTLFRAVNLVMSPGERLGLVGRNGSGKTTLLRLILGEETPDEGRVRLTRGYRAGHLSQLLSFTRPSTLEEACLGLPVQEGGWVETHRAETILAGLGFSPQDVARPPAELSGGFQVRLQLAKLLLSEPDLLLLDEPTNYLDIVSVRWLERFLSAWPGELIVITHDQDFMNRVTTHTMAIHRTRTRRMSGPTTKLYEILAQEEEIHERTRQNEARTRRREERFIERFRYKASKASVVQSRIKMLAKRGTLEQLEHDATLDFRFNAAAFTGARMIGIHELAFGYPGGPELVHDLSLEVLPGDRIAVIGKNGKGKTTFLDLLAGELTPRRGSVDLHRNACLAYFGQNNIDRLNGSQTVEEAIVSVHPDRDRGVARGICGAMMFPDSDALKRVEKLSGGERARVLLGKLLVAPANLLLLDEPTNHLDMESIDSLIEAVGQFPGAVLMVTHNERVLHALATRLVIFDRGTTRTFEGTYRDFLDRIGWADEDDRRGRAPSGPGAKPDRSAAGRRADRRQRAEAVARRARVLKPLAARMQALEAEIETLEARKQHVEQQLCDVSLQGDANAIARLSRELKELGDTIDARYTSLGEVSEEHERARTELDADNTQ